MGLFGFKKRDDFVDLGEKWRLQKQKAETIKEEIALENRNNVDSRFGQISGNSESQSSGPTVNGNPFSIFGGATPSVSDNPSDSIPIPNSEYTGESQTSAEERRRRLVKRLKDMTDKMEDLTNQLYHLQQRVELLEKKNNLGF
jgi:hypothetical protein